MYISGVRARCGSIVTSCCVRVMADYGGDDGINRSLYPSKSALSTRHATIDQLTAAVAALRRNSNSPPATDRGHLTTPVAKEDIAWWQDQPVQQRYDITVDHLATAAARGDIEGVRYIISAGINVNQCNIYGRTPLQVQ